MPALPIDRRTALLLGAGAIAASAFAGSKPSSRHVRLQYDHIIGTSLDLILEDPTGGSTEVIEEQLLS